MTHDERIAALEARLAAAEARIAALERRAAPIPQVPSMPFIPVTPLGVPTPSIPWPPPVTCDARSFQCDTPNYLRTS